MGKKGSSKTDPKRSAQRERTRKNKQKKYEKLIADKPNDSQLPVWKKKLESLR